MAVMNRTGPTSSTVTSNAITAPPAAPVPAIPGSAVSPVTVGAGQPLQQGQPNIPPQAVGVPSMMQTHPPGIAMKPGTQTPPANVLQVVKQVSKIKKNLFPPLSLQPCQE